jgi:ubiquinone/menaquinone biosynthesis C-methylase UbiE
MSDDASFKDYFSAQADDYQSYRPDYPEALFKFLAAVSPGHERALDVATGNGQAAIGLAAHFAGVRATEPSQEQLRRARSHPRVSYVRETAELIDSPDASYDLVTAAQAVHWFDQKKFYREARRVLKPRGVLAVWTYELFEAGPAVDAVIRDFYRNVVGPYWPRERRHVEEGYARLPFPGGEFAAPQLVLETRWTCRQALAYVGTWSAVAACRRLRGRDPLVLLAPPLEAAWGASARRLCWRLHLRVARKGMPVRQTLAPEGGSRQYLASERHGQG